MGQGYDSQIQQVPSVRAWQNLGQVILAVTQTGWNGEPIPEPVLDGQAQPGGRPPGKGVPLLRDTALYTPHTALCSREVDTATGSLDPCNLSRNPSPISVYKARWADKFLPLGLNLLLCFCVCPLDPLLVLWSHEGTETGWSL